MSNEGHFYYLKREYFGAKLNPLKKKDTTEADYCYFKSNPSLEANYDLKNPRSITLNNIAEKSFHKIQTAKTTTKSKMILHVEGGWPEGVKPEEAREIMNWKRSKEKQEEFPLKVKSLIETTTPIIKQNLRMDPYEEYFQEKSENVVEDSFSAKVKLVLKDNFEFPRRVRHLAWNWENQNQISACYKMQKNHILTDKNKLGCNIWDLNNPNSPVVSLKNNYEILVSAYHLKDPHILGVGCSNGTVALYDIRTAGLITSSKLEESHHESVSDFVWLKSKSNTEFITTSTDGQVVWWDIRDLSEPVIEPENSLMLVDRENDVEKEYGGMKIEYNPEAGVFI